MPYISIYSFYFSVWLGLHHIHVQSYVFGWISKYSSYISEFSIFFHEGISIYTIMRMLNTYSHFIFLFCYAQIRILFDRFKKGSLFSMEYLCQKLCQLWKQSSWILTQWMWPPQEQTVGFPHWLTLTNGQVARSWPRVFVVNCSRNVLILSNFGDHEL